MVNQYFEHFDKFGHVSSNSLGVQMSQNVTNVLISMCYNVIIWYQLSRHHLFNIYYKDSDRSTILMCVPV